MRMASGWRSTPFRLRCRSATRSRRLMLAACTGRACGWPYSMVASLPIAAANGPTSMACAITWSAANQDRKALLCCHGAGWSNAVSVGLRTGAACCATEPDGWMSQPGVWPSSPSCPVFRHCLIQCQSGPLDYENLTQTGSEPCNYIPQGSLILERIPFASERERVKMLVKTKSWNRFREQVRAEAALVSWVWSSPYHWFLPDTFRPTKSVLYQRWTPSLIS